MAAQDVGQLGAIRCSSSFHNTTLLANQSSVVNALNSKCSLNHYASRIYDDSHQPVIPDFKSFYRIARICDIAKSLAVALAAQLEKPPNLHCSPQYLPSSPFDPASSGRFVKNVLPYMLALGHFFECYRDGLDNYVPDPGPVNPRRSPSDIVADSIICSRYNRETRYRIYALYLVLKRILDEHLFSRTHENHLITMATLLDIRGCSYTYSTERYEADSTDVFTFGGLDAVKDVIAQPTIELRLGVLEDHFTRACPEHIARAHTLPPSTLSQVDRASAARICRLLPRCSVPVLDIGPRIVNVGQYYTFEREDLESFYKHMTTYEGDEPNLFR